MESVSTCHFTDYSFSEVNPELQESAGWFAATIKKKSQWARAHVNLLCVDIQSARESAEVQNELSEKVDRLKAELVVFKSLMSDVSISMKSCHQQFPSSRRHHHQA